MPLKTRIALAAGVGLALASVVPLALAQVPGAAAPTQDQAEAKSGETGKTAGRDDRPDPRKDPKAAQLSLRRMLGMSGGGSTRGGRGGFGGANSGLKGMVLTNTALQDELKLTEKQKAALKENSTTLDTQRRAIFDQMRQMRNQGGNNGRGGPGGGRGGPGGGFNNPAFTAAMTQMAQLNQQSQSATDRVLTAAQKRRLSEIEIQIEGPLAVARPQVASKLNLSPLQTQKILAIVNGMNTAQDQLRSQMFGNRGGQGGQPGFGVQPGFGGPAVAGRGTTRPTTKAGATTKKGATDASKTQANAPTANLSREDMRTRFREIGDETNRIHDEAEIKIAKVLTARQKSVYTKMLGEPFDLTLLTQGGGRGGFGGRGGDSGNNGRGGDRGTGGAPAEAGSGRTTNSR